MKTFIRTILVMVVCLAVFSSPVTAQAPTPVPFIVPPGGIAIIGFNFDDPNQFTFVCLADIPAGTEIRFTDNGWLSAGGFRSGEGILSWYTPGGCELGKIVTISQSQFKDYMTDDFSLQDNGDQILVYQQFPSNPPKFIFALNSEGTGWQSNATNKNTSAIPEGLDATNSVALNEIDNAIHTGGQEYDLPAMTFNSPSQALASIVDKTHWKGSDSTRQTMPNGSFSFTTTAVHLSEFSAETEGESAPWWALVGLVVIPVVLMIFKRPKRDCCK